jgi:hypothetical protein
MTVAKYYSKRKWMLPHFPSSDLWLVLRDVL